MKRNFKNSKGITLIALIITIIILLILAGITIINLAESGLLAKSGEAKERTIKAQLKEEIEMAIQEIQIEELPKGNNVTLESLANVQLVAKLKEITTDLGTDKITGEYKGYDYIITGEYEVVIGNRLLGEKPTITHTVDTEQIGVTQVVITVNASVSDGTIVEIVKPDGSIEQNVGQATFTVNKSGKYVFTAKSSNGRRLSYTVKITNILPSAPVIESQGGYPILTVYGVQNTQGKVTITYEDNEVFVNSYSEDNGTTWKEYTGPFEPMASTIIAKSEYREDSTIKVEATKKVVVDDAMPPEVYDGNAETGISKVGLYMDIEEDARGKNLYVDIYNRGTWGFNSDGASIVIFFNQEGQELTDCRYKITGLTRYKGLVSIPNDAVKLSITVGDGAFAATSIYEIDIGDDPIISKKIVYPKLTQNGIEAEHNLINIDYLPKCVEKLYQINDGEWKRYEKEVKVELGEIIKAKGIDKYGKETRVSEYEVTNTSDAMPPETYDKNTETSTSKVGLYMDIDETARGKNLYVDIYNRGNYAGNSDGASIVMFFNQEGEELTDCRYKITGLTRYQGIIAIPNNAVKLSVTVGDGAFAATSIYEIDIER